MVKKLVVFALVTVAVLFFCRVIIPIVLVIVSLEGIFPGIIPSFFIIAGFGIVLLFAWWIISGLSKAIETKRVDKNVRGIFQIEDDQETVMSKRESKKRRKRKDIYRYEMDLATLYALHENLKDDVLDSIFGD